MKERPILMSAPMVRAILEGRKTQTRRVVKGVRMFSAEHDARWNPHVIRPGGACPDSWSWWEGPAHGPSMYHEAACPYGRPGDRLWVRETWQNTPTLAADLQGPVMYRADCEDKPRPLAWRSPIHMPRWASRITLEVTGVRVERLNDISAEDCIAEGLSTKLREHDAVCDLRDQYRALWESINGPGSWSANPWVWVIEFARVDAQQVAA